MGVTRVRDCKSFIRLSRVIKLYSLAGVLFVWRYNEGWRGVVTRRYVSRYELEDYGMDYCVSGWTHDSNNGTQV